MFCVWIFTLLSTVFVGLCIIEEKRFVQNNKQFTRTQMRYFGLSPDTSVLRFYSYPDENTPFFQLFTNVSDSFTFSLVYPECHENRRTRLFYAMCNECYLTLEWIYEKDYFKFALENDAGIVSPRGNGNVEVTLNESFLHFKYYDYQNELKTGQRALLKGGNRIVEFGKRSLTRLYFLNVAFVNEPDQNTIAWNCSMKVEIDGNDYKLMKYDVFRPPSFLRNNFGALVIAFVGILGINCAGVLVCFFAFYPRRRPLIDVDKLNETMKWDKHSNRIKPTQDENPKPAAMDSKAAEISQQPVDRLPAKSPATTPASQNPQSPATKATSPVSAQ